MTCFGSSKKSRALQLGGIWLVIIATIRILLLETSIICEERKKNQDDYLGLSTNLLRRGNPSQSLNRIEGDLKNKEHLNLRETYLKTVIMGLLGGLTHAAFLDPNRGGTTDLTKRGNCMTRDWSTGQPRDFCIVKWDGYERLQRVKNLYERIEAEGVQGDLMECGVWRGGMTILMAALLKAHNVNNRKVWVADSFGGVPNENEQKEHPEYQKVPKVAKILDESMWGGFVYEKEANSTKVVAKNKLTVEQELVVGNFKRYGLYSEKNIRLVPGFFHESLPSVQATFGLKKLALLRVDGDLYSSTMDVLVNLYPLVSSGGYIILDDWPIDQSRQATFDFFEKQGLNKSLLNTDRLTPEDRPTDLDVNMYAYFRKP